MLGPIFAKEDDDIEACLGGTWDNHLFFFFKVHV
jgi:hypothetical protein